MIDRLNISEETLAAFCRKWKITELALFGSALRDDFGPESDIDLLVSFAPEARWGLLDLAEMEFELEEKVGREVELVSKEGIEHSKNWIRRESILSSAQPLFSAVL